ncbi:MAG: AmmeMemoRadiSam system protein B [Candidatus Omnitrophota bacterium]
MTNVRNPSVAGQFYQASRSGLSKEVASYMEGSQKEECLGAVSPHAGYIYSGMVAGKVLSRIKFKDTFIILGPNHTGIGAQFSIMARGYWRTPMGDVKIDSELADIILESSKYITEDPSAHASEHSIEVQLPFLQHIKMDFGFVPIVISNADLDTLKDVGSELADSIKISKKDVVILSSSDMTHYESHESARDKDKRAIDAILDLDENRLQNEVLSHDISMCGCAPTIVMLSALKKLGAKEAELVDYKTSGDVSGDYSSVVGYAGILIK